MAAPQKTGGGEMERITRIASDAEQLRYANEVISKLVLENEASEVWSKQWHATARKAQRSAARWRMACFLLAAFTLTWVLL